MKKILTFIFLIFFVSAKSQVAIKLMRYNPTGMGAFLFHKTISGELLWINNDDDAKWRPRFGISYVSLKTRADTFHNTVIVMDGNSTTVYPGWERYEGVNLFYGFGGIDFMGPNERNFKLYPGFDIMFGGTGYNYEISNKVRHETGNESAGLVGFRLRGGAMYRINEQYKLGLEVQRNFLLATNYTVLGSIDLGLTFVYNLNRD